MKFFKHLFLGYTSYIQAAKFIIRHKLWLYAIFPLVLFGLFFYVGNYFKELRELNDATLNSKESIGMFAWLWVFIKKMFHSVFAFLFLDTTKYLVMIILSPLLAFLSERTEKILTGNAYKFNLIQLIHDVKRGVGIALRMLIAETILAYGIWHVIAYLLGLSGTPIELTVDLIIGFYFYGFGYIDYINERLRLSVRESWDFMKKHSGLAIAIGSVFSLLFFIPSLLHTQNKIVNTLFDNLGVVVAPILAIVASTIAMHELVDLNNSQYAVKKEK